MGDFEYWINFDSNKPCILIFWPKLFLNILKRFILINIIYKIEKNTHTFTKRLHKKTFFYFFPLQFQRCFQIFLFFFKGILIHCPFCSCFFPLNFAMHCNYFYLKILEFILFSFTISHFLLFHYFLMPYLVMNTFVS